MASIVNDLFVWHLLDTWNKFVLLRFFCIHSHGMHVYVLWPNSLVDLLSHIHNNIEINMFPFIVFRFCVLSVVIFLGSAVTIASVNEQIRNECTGFFLFISWHIHQIFCLSYLDSRPERRQHLQMTTTVMHVDCVLPLVHSTVYYYIEVYLCRQSAYKRIAEIWELVFQALDLLKQRFL